MFPYWVSKWNKLNDPLRNANSIYKFKNYLVKFIKIKENPTVSICNLLGLKLLTCFGLNFTHLNEHKFRHNFRETVSPMCSCSAGVEITDHYLLRCQNFVLTPSNFLNRIFQTMLNSGIKNNLSLISLLLFGTEKIQD